MPPPRRPLYGVPVPLTVRELTPDELTDAWQLGRLAFGSAPQPPAHATAPAPGMTRYGAFDDTGRLVGRAVDLHHDQWWHGRRVPAADVAGVAVAPEARGRGIARALLTTLLRGAHERGAAISALYPTVAAPYRACGWEVTGALRVLDLPTLALPRHRPAAHLTVRPGGPTDLPAVTDLYTQVVAHRAGPLTRDGALYDHFAALRAADDLGHDGLTLVEHDGRLVGYASYDRGRGYHSDAILTLGDVLATTADAARELLGVLRGWASVTPTLRICPLPGDAVTAQLPLDAARDHSRDIFMHRPVDLAAALTSRGWPAHARGTVDFAVDDDLAPWNTGAWHLDVADGHAQVTAATTDPALRLTPRGFALLHAGAADARTVAQAGLLHHPPGHDPRALDLLTAGGPAQLLDYF
ncbi:Predicted acetyltransferase [Micromonospora siamensis]|uniref:Predicted acetyltransferase n=1 Tax=Micromonospora siamensis TaxID=299152 RepID=A0A1C5IJ75_9ACTN|nr:Predicted acetyltransferase [Micromonospora siamensis]